MLLFLHGFLGCPDDWLPIIEELKDTFFCVSLDLSQYGNILFDQDPLIEIERAILSSIQKPCVGIGYSLGGRILLELNERHPSVFSHLCLFGSHPGIRDDEERRLRSVKEQEWEDMLKEHGITYFLDKWYEQPLFSNLKTCSSFATTLTKRRNNDPKKTLTIYNRFRLSRQKAYTHFGDNILFLYGEFDDKYRDIYEKITNIQYEMIERAGHATILENPSECSKKIRSFLAKT
jgi:2-succinyl-6-hydroxy-2,4-cyclohexadiene-1-carboxylate synthase